MHAARGRSRQLMLFFRRCVYLICRGGIHAARQGCAVAWGLRLVARFRRFVGRGLDPAVAVCLMVTFLGNVAAPGSAL